MDLWILLFGPALKLAYALLAILLVWLILRWLDRINEEPYSTVAPLIRAEPFAVAHYRGLRLVALAILLGLLLSR